MARIVVPIFFVAYTALMGYAVYILAGIWHLY